MCLKKHKNRKSKFVKTAKNTKSEDFFGEGNFKHFRHLRQGGKFSRGIKKKLYSKEPSNG